MTLRRSVPNVIPATPALDRKAPALEPRMKAIADTLADARSFAREEIQRRAAFAYRYAGMHVLLFLCVGAIAAVGFPIVEGRPSLQAFGPFLGLASFYAIAALVLERVFKVKYGRWLSAWNLVFPLAWPWYVLIFFGVEGAFFVLHELLQAPLNTGLYIVVFAVSYVAEGWASRNLRHALLGFFLGVAILALPLIVHDLIIQAFVGVALFAAALFIASWIPRPIPQESRP